MENQTQSTGKRGGARVGAGRKPYDYNERYFAARGIKPLHAAEILSHVADERTLWRRVLSSEDDRVVLSALTFLVSMRDGRPAQQINVTSLGVTITTDEIAKARAIVREIVGARDHTHEQAPPLDRGANPSNPSMILENDESKGLTQTLASPLMLSGDEGGKKGG